MTLLSNIVRVLHDAEVPAYSVHSSVHELPGDPDLVVTTEGDAETAIDVLSAAVLPLGLVRQVDRRVLHVWGDPVI